MLMSSNLILLIFERQVRPLISGYGRLWLPALSLLFGGVLALIVFSGLMNGADATLTSQILEAVFWLLLFIAFGFEASNLWAEDNLDGTLDQDFVTANGTYLPLILASFVSQIFTLCLPLFLVFASLWALGGEGAIPIMSLLGLILPILSLRMLASALALRGGGSGWGRESIVFEPCGAVFLCVGCRGASIFC